MSQTRIDTPRILLGLPLLLIHADQLLAAARVLAKTVVRDSIKPRGKSRFTPKASNILVSSEKSFLCKVIGPNDHTPPSQSLTAPSQTIRPKPTIVQITPRRTSERRRTRRTSGASSSAGTG